MTEGDSSWSLGIWIGLPIGVVLTLIFLGVGLYYLAGYFWNRSDYNSGFWLGTAVISLALGLITVGVTAGALYPWKAEYHQWVTKVGTVKTISSRLISGGEGVVNQRFVVVYEDGREFSCDDTRCALVKPGDTLVVTCKRKWQYTGRDGYDCNYLDNVQARES